jgi:hypothetical protein
MANEKKIQRNFQTEVSIEFQKHEGGNIYARVTRGGGEGAYTLDIRVSYTAAYKWRKDVVVSKTYTVSDVWIEAIPNCFRVDTLPLVMVDIAMHKQWLLNMLLNLESKIKASQPANA